MAGAGACAPAIAKRPRAPIAGLGRRISRARTGPSARRAGVRRRSVPPAHFETPSKSTARQSFPSACQAPAGQNSSGRQTSLVRPRHLAARFSRERQAPQAPHPFGEIGSPRATARITRGPSGRGKRRGRSAPSRTSSRSSARSAPRGTPCPAKDGRVLPGHLRSPLEAGKIGARVDDSEAGRPQVPSLRHVDQDRNSSKIGVFTDWFRHDQDP